MNRKALALYFVLFFTLFCISASAQVEQLYADIVTDENAFLEELDAWFTSPEAKNPRTASLLRIEVNGSDATTHYIILDYADYASWESSMDAAYKSSDFAKMQRRAAGIASGSGEAMYQRIADNGKSWSDGDYIFAIGVAVSPGGASAYLKAFNGYLNSALAKKAPGVIRLLSTVAGAENSHTAIFSAPTLASLMQFLDAHSGSKEMENFESQVKGISTATGSSLHKVLKVWK